MTITRINEFRATQETADELHRFLQSLIPYISSSDGCLGCDVLRSVDDKTRFAVIEKWASMDSHKSSIERFPKEEMQSAMRLFAEPPNGVNYQG